MFNHFKRFTAMLLILCTLIPLMTVGVGAADMPELTVNNYTITLTNADNIRDIRYAIGEYTTVAEIKAAEGNVALSNKVVVNNTKDGIFTYTLPKTGYYTLWVRMQDGTNYFMPCDMTD
ncbi:MAG: hypothetical protein IKU19_02810, partial [Clostridia bacterium]|nr:hypothetical protein [Clostridia bacterium]